MQKQEETRIYSFDDATLIQRCDALYGSLLRDQPDLNYRNITPVVLNAFKGQIDTFRDTDTDIEWQGILSTVAGKKNQVRTELHIQVGDIRNMAQNVFGLGKGLYKTFGFSNLDRLDDNNYVRAAKRVHRLATTLVTELSPEGLNAAVLGNLQNKIQEFDEEIDRVEEKVDERDIATQNRIMLGNALYRTASKLAGVGKTHFFSRDEARYNDYILLPPVDSDTNEDTDPLPPTP